MEPAKEIYMGDVKDIVEKLKSLKDQYPKCYKVAELYLDFTSGNLDEDGIALRRSEILDIEKHLIEWTKAHPNNGGTIMQPEESALILINDLRTKGLLK
jgi:hypothetical protein